jgi:hypothetical protein
VKAAVARAPLLQAAAAAAAALSSNAIVAAEWTFVPTGQLVTANEDNARLKSDGGNTSTALGANATLQIQRRTERMNLSITPRVGALRYQHDSGLDRDEQQLDAKLRWAGENSTWDGSLNAARDTTLTSELGNTGLTQVNRRHEGIDMLLQPTWRLTERVTVGTSAMWEINRYPGNDITELQNYQYGNLSLFTSRSFTDRATLTLSAAAGHLNAEQKGSNSDNANARLQFSYVWSELWQMSLAAGPSWVRTDVRSEQGTIYNAAISRALEMGALSLSVGRTVSPSGRGVLTEVEDATLAYSTQWTERLSGGLTLGYVHRSDAIPAFGFEFNDVRYARAGAAINWRVAQSWQLALSGGNTAQRVRESDTARGYDVRFSVSWTGDAHVY